MSHLRTVIAQSRSQESDEINTVNDLLRKQRERMDGLEKRMEALEGNAGP